MVKSSTKNTFYIISSIILSLIVHFCFLAIFMQIKLPDPSLNSPEKKVVRRFKLLPLKDKKNEKIEKKEVQNVELTKIKKIDLPSNIDKKVDLPNNNLKDEDSGIDKKYDLPPLENIKTVSKAPKLPKIVTVDGDSLPESRKQFNRVIIPKLPRSENVTYFAVSSDKNGNFAPKAPLPVKMRMSFPSKKSKNPMAQLPTTPETRLITEDKVINMDLMINVQLYKYPLPDGGGFFRIALLPNSQSNTLETFRKDVIFLIDVSGSIGRVRLDELKAGLFRTLETFHPQDRFNIIAFRAGNIPLFAKSQHPTKENIKKAREFLFKLRHTGSTNIYSALNLYTGKQHRVAARPLILFLLSDGKVNSGEIVNSRNVINSISNSNHNGAAIYSFSCGQYKNSFLMDLIAYRNRGESKDVKYTGNSNIPLSRFIYDVSAIKISDLEYQVSSNLAKNTFPKRLPNLHKGKILSIYGVYPPGTNEIGLRITGMDSSGIRRELVFGGNLSDAQKANNDLPQKWAEQYIYHLYSQLTVKYDERIKQEIIDTTLKYNLDFPYLEKHLRPERKNYVK